MLDCLDLVLAGGLEKITYSRTWEVGVMTKDEMRLFSRRLKKLSVHTGYMSYGEKQLFAAAQSLDNAVNWFEVEIITEE